MARSRGRRLSPAGAKRRLQDCFGLSPALRVFKLSWAKAQAASRLLGSAAKRAVSQLTLTGKWPLAPAYLSARPASHLLQLLSCASLELAWSILPRAALVLTEARLPFWRSCVGSKVAPFQMPLSPENGRADRQLLERDELGDQVQSARVSQRGRRCRRGPTSGATWARRSHGRPGAFCSRETSVQHRVRMVHMRCHLLRNCTLW